MGKKLAIVFCVHHKPWLMMGSLISTLAQTYRDFDLVLLYQKGNGACLNKKSYDEYRKIAVECGGNVMLSEYDPKVKEICDIKQINITELELENDHGLDTGAYYKFIKTGLWKKYDYVFLIQEGAIFTGADVVDSTLKFAQKNNVHFLSSGHEKQRLPKEVFMNWSRRQPNPSKLGIFHDEMITEAFKIFKRDADFDALFNKWGSDFEIQNQHHVLDLGEEYRRINSARNRLYETLFKGCEKKVISRDSFSRILRSFDSLKKIYEDSRSLYSIRGNYLRRAIQKPYIVVDRRNKQLCEIVDFKEEGNTKFHTANDDNVQWFGCCCIHMLSNAFLEAFSAKLDKFRIYEVLELPFSATALEVIWGFLPSWLGFDKWFFDGINRPRKNFSTREWEDYPHCMVHYLNWYFRGKFNVCQNGDFIKIRKNSKDMSYLRDILNVRYF